MATLRIEDLHKSFGRLDVLNGIDLSLDEGEFLVLLGASGCGKSTLLNIIAGLETPTSGRILIDGRVVNDVHPKDRDIAMVFQSYALYPTMTVAGNIGFGLRMRGVPRAASDLAVQRVAKLLQIEHLLDRRPSQLSGGQRQRVAMGRAMVRQPKIFLFDEPLSNLDARMRVDMRAEIKKLHQLLGTTVVYVTHDQIEAMTLATRIAIVKDGQIQQCAAPQEIYDRPANIFVASAIGSPPMNFVPAIVAAEGETIGVSIKGWNFGPASSLFLPLPQVSPKLADWMGEPVILGLRPEAVTSWSAALARGTPGWARVQCPVGGLEPTGADVLARISLGGQDVVARLAPKDAPAEGALGDFMIDLSRVSLFDPKDDKRISLL